MMQMHETNVAVWSFNDQKFVYFVPTTPGEKRVRIDVYDGEENYAVFAAWYSDESHFDLINDGGKPRELKDWRIDLT